MSSRELVIRTLNHQPVSRIPRDLWPPISRGAAREDEIAEIGVRFPSDIIHVELHPLHGKKPAVKSAKGGENSDVWGCHWQRDAEGTLVPAGPAPLAELAKVAAYHPPTELLERSRFAKVNKTCQSSNRFVLGWSETRPFDRLRALRGMDTALVDLARGTKDVCGLLAMLHETSCKELELWADTELDGVVFRDDLGSPDGLLIAPEMWRELFRPLYRDYCRILHAKDKFAFFHSNGNIADIFGDLIRVGIDAVHSQLHLMDVDRLAKRYRGRITFWGETDSQRLRNPGPRDEFRQAVQAARKALDSGHGGVIAQCQWAPGVRVQTIALYFEQWLAPLPSHAQ